MTLFLVTFVLGAVFGVAITVLIITMMAAHTRSLTFRVKR